MNREKTILYCDKTIKFGLILLALASPLSISGTEGALLLCLLVWAVKLIFDKERSFVRTPLDLPILGLFLATIISVIFSVDPANSLKELRSMWIILTYFLFVHYANDIPTIKKILRVLIISTTIAACYGIFQHITGIDIIHPFEEGRAAFEGKLRVQGFFNKPLTFGEYLIIILSLMIGLLLNGKRKAILLLSAMVIFLALLWTYTRSSWLGFGSALIAVGIMKGKRVSVSILTAVVVISLMMFALSPTMLKRAKSIFDTSNPRVPIWQSSLLMIKDHPLTGIGIGNYSRVCPDYYKRFSNKELSQSHAHNNLLQMMVTRGIFGLAAFLYLWIVLFKHGILSYLRTDDSYSKALLLGGLAAMVGLNVSGLFEHNFGDSEVAILMWLVMGMIMVLGKSNE